MSDNNLNEQGAAGQSGLPEVPEIVNPYESDTLPPTYPYPSNGVYPAYTLPRPIRKRFGGLFQRLTLGLLLTVTGLMSFLFITAVGSNHATLTTAVTSTTSSTGASVLTGQTLASSPTAGPILTVQQVSQKVRASVVQITTEQNVSTTGSSRFGGSTQTGTTQETGVGSGIIYDQAGYILTNNHVVEGADSLLVSLTDGRTFQGTVVGTDPVTDLAVVKIDPAGSTLPVAVLGDSDALQVGDGVVAIGNALALEGGPTLTTGVVSALNRSVAEPATQSATGNFSSSSTASTSGTQLYNLIQTDAAINPGNSGGPLVNMEGQVIGINTLAAGQVETGIQTEGIGFAISINGAKTIAQQIVATGKVNHAMLGITSQPLTSAMATSLKLSVTQGTVVVQVQSGSAAAQAGLKQGDVITAIDNQKLTGESTLGQIINGHQPGDTVQLSVITPQANGGSGQVQVVSVTLAQRTGN